jgi:hypothetical protein
MLLQIGQKLEAVVELTKDDYLVLSFPERPGVVGFAATSDLNLQSLQAPRSFSLAQKLQATITALPTDSTGAHCFAKDFSAHEEPVAAESSQQCLCLLRCPGMLTMPENEAYHGCGRRQAAGTRARGGVLCK